MPLIRNNQTWFKTNRDIKANKLDQLEIPQMITRPINQSNKYYKIKPMDK